MNLLMKTLFVRSLFVAGLLLLIAACGNRNAEKKIAALESRIAELEGKKGDAAVPTEATEAAPEEKPEGPLPTIDYAETDFDFGTINEGDIVEHTFKIKNTGEAPLIIQSAKPSCGCTVPDWTKEPIPVGGEGFIKAKFDSNGKTNIQNKTITVTSNTWPKQTMVRFKAMVTPKAQ
jgi:Protein of unknown function (DUF1573)